MVIQSLRLENFRNIKELCLTADQSVNIIYGRNAQGKTNIIEAIWLLSGSKSFRSSKDADYINFDAKACKIEAVYDDNGIEKTNAIKIDREGSKAAFFSGGQLERVSQLNGSLYEVVFSPTHLSLIKDAPENRRKFLDTAICQIMPRYDSMLNDYSRLLNHRNSLLKDINFSSSLIEMLEVFDYKLSQSAASITLSRKRYIDKLKVASKEHYGGISQNKEQLSLSYESALSQPLEDMDIKALTESFVQALYKKRSEDIRFQTTSIGPHRDEMLVEINGLSARSFGSQGQQRSAVLALKLAEASVIEQSTGGAPVILLDDVLSELDQGRRQYILQNLRDRQIFITCCETSMLRKLTNCGKFMIKSGAVSQKPEIIEKPLKAKPAGHKKPKTKKKPALRKS